MVNFVEHCRVVVFFRVVVEAYHAVLLVNASVDLTIFNLRNTKKNIKFTAKLFVVILMWMKCTLNTLERVPGRFKG